jgi:hypothetical protein
VHNAGDTPIAPPPSNKDAKKHKKVETSTKPQTASKDNKDDDLVLSPPPLQKSKKLKTEKMK